MQLGRESARLWGEGDRLRLQSFCRKWNGGGEVALSRRKPL